LTGFTLETGVQFPVAALELLILSSHPDTLEGQSSHLSPLGNFSALEEKQRKTRM
jgi:hypothetical protein